ncbi:MAG TPA: hypothetical protein VM347_31685 [Nonomuraea sp.]|nr:hypothetical protein [Nonomuraea sp.]
MRLTSVVLFLLWLLPAPASSQASRLTTMVGAGNSFSGIGVLGDWRPFARGPFSLMLSVGSTKTFFNVQHASEPWVDNSVSSFAASVGLRANAGSGRHAGFLELALLPVDDDIVEISVARSRLQMLYGLGLQLGYRALIGSGISVNALGGAGYALNQGVAASRWKPLFGFGLGYAWPKH